ncbi:LysR family transcriptional regulator [Aquincola sp. S2]|uniref:LysR family transcriptional regulator n=1 Tax=Pseudaquabacterium terrae TaxID=2732868 RepID=A0ABX2E9H5_9BURK|nr:LysR family transcriptional regulator [Aquabacterium terrae]NRF65400.1 LysR family transcriptional regulator [Aquabacterium terrae]
MPDTLRHATLRQWQIFLVAAEHESFVRAAQLLHLTQPAVSMQMSQLAESVGLPLFEKRGRNLALTQAGQTLVPFAERLAETLRDAGEAIDALQGLHRGRLRIALVTTTRYFMPRLIAQFRQAHPQIELDVSIEHREGVIGRLDGNQVDLAIMGRPPTHLALQAEPFAKHPHGVIAAPDHPLAGKRRVQPKKVAREAFIAREAGSGTRHAMEQYFAAHGLDPPLAREMTSNESIKQEVMAGMGLAFISLHTVLLEHQTGHLALLDLQGLPVVRDWYVLYRSGRRLSPAAAAFREFLKAEAPGYMARLLPAGAKGRRV